MTVRVENLVVNDWLRNKAGNVAIVLHLDIHTDEVILIDTNDAKPLPRSVSARALSDYIKVVDNGATQATELLQTDKERAAAEFALNVIKPLVDDPSIYDRDSRGPLVRARAHECSISKKTVLSYLRRYWLGGMTVNALAPRFRDRGVLSKNSTVTSKVARGRRPDGNRYTPFDCTHSDEIEKIKKAIRKEYLSSDYKTIEDAYQACLQNYYSYRDKNGKRILLPAGECPTMRQFAYRLKKDFSITDIGTAKRGKKKFALTERAKLGSVMADCLGVGHIYEIDATIADVWLVSSAPDSRHKIIGKPTLYFVYDRWSRLIVGFHVTLESASWMAATQAILSILEPKEALCARYDVPYDAADWPADGILPAIFLADRGEMLSYASDNVTSLGPEVKNPPSDRADWKPIVEGGFRQQYARIRAVTAGYEPPQEALKRRARKYHLDASLTLAEFTKKILLCVIAHNREPIAHYPLTPQQLTRSIPPIPRELWNFEAPSRASSLRRCHYGIAKAALRPTNQATVKDSGIEFMGCLYSAPQLESAGWFVRARKRRFAVPISYDPRLCDSIEVHAKELGGTPVPVYLTPASEAYRGMSFGEVAAYLQMRKSILQEMVHHKRQVRSDFNDAADPISANARRLRKADSKGKARSARRQDTKEERERERRIERHRDAGADAPPVVSAEPMDLPEAVCPTESDFSTTNTPATNKLADLRRNLFHARQ